MEVRGQLHVSATSHPGKDVKVTDIDLILIQTSALELYMADNSVTDSLFFKDTPS